MTTDTRKPFGLLVVTTDVALEDGRRVPIAKYSVLDPDRFAAGEPATVAQARIPRDFEDDHGAHPEYLAMLETAGAQFREVYHYGPDSGRNLGRE
jgi:hypothetical protein